MEYFKRIEQELIKDWHKIQLETANHLKTAAIKAYYIKFRMYQEQKRRRYVLADI